MFSYEQRIKAVKLLIQYDMSYATVIRELGYPTSKSLRGWYQEYIKANSLHKLFIKQYKYTEKQKSIAVKYYLEHGKCVMRTCRKLGYPSRPLLDQWIAELAPNQKKYCHSSDAVVKYTGKEKAQAVIDLCSRNGTAKEIAANYGTTRENLYNWKRHLLTEGRVNLMNNNRMKPPDTSDLSKLIDKKNKLEAQVSELQKQVHRLKIERYLYEKAAEL